MSQKRSIDQLADTTKESQGVEVHFQVESLSPVKKARSGINYYDGLVNDGTRKVHLVGFDVDSQPQLTTLTQQKTPIKATNC